MSWLNDSRLYQAKVWYCGVCRQRTPTEFNPEWVADGRPMRFEKHYDWFSRCSYCKTQHYVSDINCPRCGGPSESPEGPIAAYCTVCDNQDVEYDDESCAECGASKAFFQVIWDTGTMLEMTQPEYNPSYSLNFGVTGYDWAERHQCPLCRHKFWISNSSC